MKKEYIDIIAKELMECHYGKDYAYECAEEWTTENVIYLHGEDVDVLWYLQEVGDLRLEFIYNLKEKRFLTDEELEEVADEFKG